MNERQCIQVILYIYRLIKIKFSNQNNANKSVNNNRYKGYNSAGAGQRSPYGRPSANIDVLAHW